MAGIAQVVTVAFLVAQLRFAGAQVVAAQESIKSQQIELTKQTTASIEVAQGANLLDIVQYIEKPEHLGARGIVESLLGKELDAWTERKEGG